MSNSDAPRIAVDATPLLGQPTGIGGFVRMLLTYEKHPEFTTAYALSARGAKDLPNFLPNGIKAAPLRLPAGPLMKRWKHHDSPKLETLGIKADLVHGTNFVVPPTKAAKIVTVHDLTCVRYPELCTPTSLEYPALIQRAIDNGAFVHTPTEAVADEVIEHFDVDRNRVRAVHHGLDTKPSPTVGIADITGGRDYVLAVGTVEPRKDYPMLVRAFDRVAGNNPNLQLVIAGASGWGAEALHEAIHKANYNSRIRVVGYVDDATRFSLIRGAKVLAFPSIYEGFGLPPLEAMRVGVPVVTTEVPAVQEVCGSAAVFVPVGDDRAFGEAIDASINNDELRTFLISQGAVRASKYSWIINHHRMRILYSEALAHR